MSAIRSTRGGALLEAVIALAVLGTVTSGAVRVVLETTDALARSHRREREIEQASRVLTAATLWSRRELAERTGASSVGRWRIVVRQRSATVFEIQVSAADTDELVGTAVYRESEAR